MLHSLLRPQVVQKMRNFPVVSCNAHLRFKGNNLLCPFKNKERIIFKSAPQQYYGLKTIGPLQVAIHVVQNRRTGEQKSHWDKTNKGNYHLKLCMPFVCLVPVRLLLTSTAVLYHVNGYLQRAYSLLLGQVAHWTEFLSEQI